MRASGYASAKSNRAWASSSRYLPGCRPGRSRSRLRSAAVKDWGWLRGFAATSWCGFDSTGCASRAATCAIHPGFSGRCSKQPSKATSSPTSRSATSRSTAPIPGTTCRTRPGKPVHVSARNTRNRRERRMRRTLFESLARRPLTEAPPAPADAALAELAASVERAARRRLGRSLAIREVDAGSCNGCELEIHALNNAFYDLERFGLRFVASPRHADVLLVTGPVTKNMREALQRTYHATPDPKWVVAVGDCAVDGGLFASSYAVVGGVAGVVPVDLHIRGCPLRPMQLLKGLLSLLDQG